MELHWQCSHNIWPILIDMDQKNRKTENVSQRSLISTDLKGLGEESVKSSGFTSVVTEHSCSPQTIFVMQLLPKSTWQSEESFGQKWWARKMKYYGGVGVGSYFAFCFKTHNTSLWHLQHFFTLHPSLESICLLISREENIKKTSLSLVRGVQLVNLHQRCAVETGYF